MTFSKKGKIKAAFIANSPAPYRNKVYDALSKIENIDLKVFYCQKKEKHRDWEIDLKHPYVFLKGLSVFFDHERTIHFSPSIIFELFKLKPQVVVSCGFTPTMLLSFLYAYLTRTKHLIFVDSTLKTDAQLSKINIFFRKVIVKRSNGFISPSKMTDDSLIEYGASKSKIFRSCLAIDNELFHNQSTHDKRPFDIGFCGQLIERKNPLFLTEVLSKIAKNRDISIRICGTGPLLNDFLKNLEEANVNFQYDGHLDSKKIIEFYSSIKIFAFPTVYDCWGLVVNEAMASGAVVISSPHTGAAGELIIDKKTGFIEENEIDVWKKRIISILDKQIKVEKIIKEAEKNVLKYNHFDACKGLEKAITLSK